MKQRVAGPARTQLRRLASHAYPLSPAYDAALGGAGHWDVDVPHISGTFSSVHGWRTYMTGGLSDARCSNTGIELLSERRDSS